MSYSRLSNLSWITLMLSRKTIKEGLKNADFIVFPAKWAYNEALKYYNKPKKFAIIPFGANIDDPGVEIAESRCFAKIIQKGHIDLLFVGKDWTEKGGDIAVETAKELRKRGINAILHIVVTNLPCVVDENFIIIYGYLDKTKEGDRKKLDELYRLSDVLIFPSLREGFPIVVLEASAYGLPILGYNTIGVSDAVKDGKTGILLRLNQSAISFANAIEAWYINPSFYDSLVRQARRYYEEEVNWRVSILRLMDKIKECLE